MRLAPSVVALGLAATLSACGPAADRGAVPTADHPALREQTDAGAPVAPEPVELPPEALALLERSPPDLAGARALAADYRRQGRYPLATLLLERLVALVPDDISVVRALVEVYIDSRRDDQALRVAGAAAQRFGDEASYGLLGEIFESMQSEDAFVRAIAAYEQAAARSTSFDWHFRMARLLERQVATADRALAVYRHILEKAPSDEMVRLAGSKARNLAEVTDGIPWLRSFVAGLRSAFPGRAVYQEVLAKVDAIAFPQDCADVNGLSHRALTTAPPGTAIPILAQVNTALGATEVVLHHRAAAGFQRIPMTRSSACNYQAAIPPPAPAVPAMHYWLGAYDASGKLLATSGSAGSPNLVEIR